MQTTRVDAYYRQGLLDGREWTDVASLLTILGQSLAEALNLPPKVAIRQTIASYMARLDAVPDLTRYPELRGMRDCLLAHHRGVAEAAGCELQDVMLQANYLYMSVAALRVSTPTPQSPAGCTMIHVPRSDRGRLVANNNDGLASHRHCRHPGWIESNRAGLVLGTVSSGLFDDELSPEIFPAPALRLASELCATTAEAVDLLGHLNHFWGPCNLLIADRQGHAAVMEKSTCRFGLRHSDDGFIATTEMAAEEPSFRDYLWSTRERSLVARGLDHDSVDWAYWQACDRRSKRLSSRLAALRGTPTFADVEAIIYEHTGEADQIHMDGSLCHPDQGAGEWSLRTAIWAIDEARVQVSYAEPPVGSHLTPRQWLSCTDFEPVF